MQVDSGVCLSSSCDRQREASCSVERRGRELHVTSVLRRQRPDGAEVACTDDCRRELAVCKTPKLEVETYTLMFAGKALRFEVPGKLDRTILESPPPG